MAIYVKPIPVLRGKVAERFEAQARENEANAGSIDFSKQFEAYRRIMARYNLKRFQ